VENVDIKKTTMPGGRGKNVAQIMYTDVSKCVKMIK
jgi:hypothetical protein